MDETPVVTEATRAALAAAAEHLPVGDTQDFADTDRGLIARRASRTIEGPDGRVVWDLDAYSFLDGPAPDTASPSLWRQGQLCAKDGLFEVVPGIYQVRGMDLSNMTVIESDTGVIVIDPLTCRETAAAAFALYTEHRGERAVRAMIYTHSHVDHFGGVKGIISQEQVDGGLPVIAPAGFLGHAVAENIYAGTAMSRRATYMYGSALPKGPTSQIGTGLGLAVPAGQITLIAPTVEVTHTGQEMVLDGVRIEFQMTPGTEAPAEMNFYFPDHHALCAAENASHTLHNVLTLRGAVVRDAHAWAHYLTETIDLWGADLDVVFASHHWPTWGRERAVEYLAAQRDVYLYLHDQTLRLLNKGLVGSEIAETITLPPALEATWHVHGYYGSVSHNVKAVYQRYLGWYEGNPARLWPHPPVDAAQRYVAAMGGTDAVVAKAGVAYDEGDYRWAVELLNHVLFADENHAAARSLQADSMEQLGFGSENGTWRNAFLTGAYELRHGSVGTPTSSAPGDVLGALTVAQMFDSLAIRIDGPRAWDDHLTIDWVVTDTGTVHALELRNGTLNHRTVPAATTGTTTFTLTRAALIGVLTRRLDLITALADGTVVCDGDPAVLGRLVGYIDRPDPGFAIVTP